MELWLKFLREFIGRSFFLDNKWNTSLPLELYTGAAGSKGYGAIFGPHWFYGSFTDQWQSLDITFLELFLIALSVRMWGSQMANRCIVFVTDNAALVSIINQQTSKRKLVMISIRDLVLTALNYNIIFRARHIPGVVFLASDQYTLSMRTYPPFRNKSPFESKT